MVDVEAWREGRSGGRAGAPELAEEMAEGLVGHRAVEVALWNLDRVLVGDERVRLTGADVLVRAAAVCAAVRAANPEGRPVAVLRGHDAGAVVAVLGVIASGAPLVVLDPRTPAVRLRHYVEAAGATVCVSDAERAATAAEAGLPAARTALRAKRATGWLR